MTTGALAMFERFGCLVLVALANTSLFAGELQSITLHDGSTVNAEVLSLNKGGYRLKSPTLGNVTVNAGDVRTIQPIRDASAPTKNNQTRLPADIEQIQSSLLANGDTVNLIMALQNNASVKAVLADTDIMAAIQREDYEFLANNPKIKKLMNNAEIKQITRSVAR
jgi:hypothetical protein